MESLNPACDITGDPDFLPWIREEAKNWTRIWTEEITRSIPAYGNVPRGELEEHVSRHVLGLIEFWEKGDESSLLEFYRELAHRRIRQEIRMREVVRAFLLGRDALTRMSPEECLNREGICKTFDRCVVHLVGCYEEVAEEVTEKTRIRLRETEKESHHFQAEWEILDQILTTIEVGIMLLDPDLKVAWVNKGMPREILQIDPEDARGRPCSEVLIRSLVECEHCQSLEALHGSSTLRLYREIRVEDRNRDYLKIVRPMPIGTERHILEVYLDITEQQDAQRALARTQELIQNILNSSVSAIIASDLRGKITLVNRTAQRMLGYSERELLGLSVRHLYSRGYDEARKIMRIIKEKEALVDRETQLRSASGESVPVRMSAALLRDEAGHLIGTMSFSHDLRTETALRKKAATHEGNLLAILQGSTDGLVVLDPDERVVLWNRGATLLLGVDDEEAIGQPIQRFLPSEIFELSPADTDAEGTQRFEACIPNEGGTDLDLLVTWTQRPRTGGGQGGSSMVLKDITEVKRLEKDLAQAEHLAGLGRLSASVAHEIKNPIAGLLGAMEIISQLHEPDDPRFEILQEALGQIRRMDSLVKDLLSYAKPVPLKTEPVPVALLIESSIPLVQHALAESRVQLDTRIPPNLADVMADPQQLQQVLCNLMQNGIQACSSGGTLAIEAEQRNGEVGIHIRDTGCGIPEEDLPQIFQPFYTTKHIGTGLGLSIVNRILSTHQGRCEVSSRVGEGSTFTVFLPAAEGEYHGS